ncbi:hypothetical protein BG004_003051 [Podila humilis]|nr:hypothetical protein BG004_003051 [Podila humilis]
MLESSAQRVLQIPELLDLICAAVSKIPPKKGTFLHSRRDAKTALRQLRLVSKSFHHAVRPYFRVKVKSIDVGRRSYDRNTYAETDRVRQKIVACGPFIDKITLDADHHKAIALAAKHCTNIRELSLRYLEASGVHPGCSDYTEALAVWAVLPNKPLTTVNAVMELAYDDGIVTFHEFDRDRPFFRDILHLRIKFSNPREHHTIEIRNLCHHPIKWMRFLSFLCYFRRLESLRLTGIYVSWTLMPARVLDPISLKPMECRNVTQLYLERDSVTLAAIFQLNRLCPNLTTLAVYNIIRQARDDDEKDDDEVEEEEEDWYDSDDPEFDDPEFDDPEFDELKESTAPTSGCMNSPLMQAPACKLRPVFDYESSTDARTRLTLQRLVLNHAYARDLEELRAWAPDLDDQGLIVTRIFTLDGIHVVEPN